VTATIYDEEHEEHIVKTMTVEEMLDSYTNEGCPPIYLNPERKKGQWIRNDNGTYSCSVCQSWIPEQQHCYARYCLYCGADMRGESK
jgi:hypothetical protein